MYDPATARFISEDTYRGDPGDPLSLNLYTYCFNNPLIYHDPTGHVVDTVLDVVSVGFSLYDMITDPSWENALYLLWDVASVCIPFVPGSYVAKAVKYTSKFIKGMDNAFGATKLFNKINNGANMMFDTFKFNNKLDTGMDLAKRADNAITFIDKSNDASKALDAYNDTSKLVEAGQDFGNLAEAVDDGSDMLKLVDKTEDGIDALKDSQKALNAAGDAQDLSKLDNAPDLSLNKVETSIPDAYKGGTKTVDVELKYKDGWTAAQKAEADAKVKALTESNTVKTQPVRSGTAASSRYKSAYGETSVPNGYDVDHTIDLQLGGADDILNMNPLDLSVNRSLGVQIKNAMKDYDIGTIFDKFTIR